MPQANVEQEHEHERDGDADVLVELKRKVTKREPFRHERQPEHPPARYEQKEDREREQPMDDDGGAAVATLLHVASALSAHERSSENRATHAVRSIRCNTNQTTVGQRASLRIKGPAFIAARNPAASIKSKSENTAIARRGAQRRIFTRAAPTNIENKPASVPIAPS